MSFRSAIPDFSLANSLYIGATVSFWGVDTNGNKSGTLPILYANPTGPQSVGNPQVLGGEGKFSFPVYHDVPLIAEVSDVTGGSTQTGIIMPAAGWAGDWTPGTPYQVNAFVRDAVGLSIYAVTQSYVSGGSIATDVANGNLELVFQGESAAIASNAAAQATAAAVIAVQAANDAQAAIVITPSGVGAVQRTIQNKALDQATPQDYGTLQQAVTARKNIEGRAGVIISATGVILSNSDSYDGKNASITALAGSFIFELRNHYPIVERLYITDNLLSSEAAVKFTGGRYPSARHIISPNTGVAGIVFAPAGSTYTALAELIGLRFEGITGTGIVVGSSVPEIQGFGIYCAGKLDYVGGFGRPQVGTVGWRQNTPVVSGNAVGGHQIFGANMISVETGWHLTDAQLSRYIGVIADSTRGYGVILDGTCDKVTFIDLFVGASMGILVKGNCLNIDFSVLETQSIGQIPPWGQNPFYNSAGPYYALTLEDNAKVTVDGNTWRGNKKVSVASTAKLTITGGHWFHGRSTANIAAGATAYLAEKEYAAFGDAIFRVPYDGYLMMAKVASSGAPGAGETATFTVQINAVDTAMVVTLTGAPGTGAFSGQIYDGSIFVTKDQSITLKAAKSAAANLSGRYNFDVLMLRA